MESTSRRLRGAARYPYAVSLTWLCLAGSSRAVLQSTGSVYCEERGSSTQQAQLPGSCWGEHAATWPCTLLLSAPHSGPCGLAGSSTRSTAVLAKPGINTSFYDTQVLPVAGYIFCRLLVRGYNIPQLTIAGPCTSSAVHCDIFTVPFTGAHVS